MSRRVLAYARQSLSRTPEESLSIEFQLAECVAYATRQGWTVVATYSDPDTKGWRRNRPGFDAMLSAVQQGTGDGVLVFKLSRFARDLVMQEEVVREIEDAGGELISITEPHINTPMIRQILGAVNEDNRRVQSDWLSAAFAARARKGLHHGYAPYGYRLEDGRLVLGHDADRARQMWQWALEGHGSPEITYRANERGWTTRNGKAWVQTTVLRVLRNPAYAGHVEHRGEIVARDAHPALVTDGEYRQVQATIDRRSHQRRKAEPSWAEGFVFHACGRRMYLAQWAADGQERSRFRCQGVWNTKMRTGARCTHRPASVFASKVEAGLAAAVVDLARRAVPLPKAVAAIERAAGATDRERAQQRARLERRLVDLEAQRQRLLDLVLQERVDADLYGQRDDALKVEVATVRTTLTETPALPTAAEIERQHADLARLLGVVTVVARDRPAGLVPLLATLGARYVLGDGPGRLEVKASLQPYFADSC